jgi:hypothetical protein
MSTNLWNWQRYRDTVQMALSFVDPAEFKVRIASPIPTFRLPWSNDRNLDLLLDTRLLKRLHMHHVWSIQMFNQMQP